MLWYVEVELDSVVNLRDACLVVTVQPRYSSGIVGPKGGVVVSHMRPKSQMIFPQHTFAEDHEIPMVIHDEDEAIVRWTNLNCEDEEITEANIDYVGPLMETEMPENIKEEYILQIPVPKEREDSVHNLLYKDRDANWHVLDVEKTDTECVGEVTVDAPIQRAVSVQSSRRIPSKSAQKVGETIIAAHKVRQVVFFVAVKSKPILQIHIECCLKKAYENIICEVRRFNFELMTHEEFDMYLADDKVKVTFYVTGDFSMRNLGDGDTSRPTVLYFDISQARSRVQDVLVPTATANVLTGYVELEVEWAKIPARCRFADQDCFRKKLLVCVEQGITHRKRPQSGGTLKQAVGESKAIIKAHKVRQVVFFVAVKSKPNLLIHIECCLQEVYKNSLYDVRSCNFELMTSEEFDVYLPDDKVKVTFCVTGDFSMRNLGDGDTSRPTVLYFDISQTRSRVQDMLVPTATANVLTGYVELEVEWTNIPARFHIADQDYFRKKLLVCVEQGSIHRERPHHTTGGTLHQSVDMMERSRTLMENLDEYLERGLGLCSGTVVTQRSKHVNRQRRLTAGVVKWAEERQRPTIADLVETMAYKDSFRRLADKLRAIGIQETRSDKH